MWPSMSLERSASCPVLLVPNGGEQDEPFWETPHRANLVISWGVPVPYHLPTWTWIFQSLDGDAWSSSIDLVVPVNEFEVTVKLFCLVGHAVRCMPINFHQVRVKIEMYWCEAVDLVHALKCCCSSTVTGAEILTTSKHCAFYLVNTQFNVTSQLVDKPSSCEDGGSRAFWMGCGLWRGVGCLNSLFFLLGLWHHGKGWLCQRSVVPPDLSWQFSRLVKTGGKINSNSQMMIG